MFPPLLAEAERAFLTRPEALATDLHTTNTEDHKAFHTRAATTHWTRDAVGSSVTVHPRARHSSEKCIVKERRDHSSLAVCALLAHALVKSLTEVIRQHTTSDVPTRFEVLHDDRERLGICVTILVQWI